MGVRLPLRLVSSHHGDVERYALDLRGHLERHMTLDDRLDENPQNRVVHVHIHLGDPIVQEQNHG